MNDFKKSNTWKYQLTTANNFISILENGEEHAMH